MLKRLLLLLLIIGAIFLVVERVETPRNIIKVVPTDDIFPSPSVLPSPSPIPVTKILSGGSHIFQSFNNCGPAALSMALSYYGIQESQEKLGADLRPYQNPEGNNDDKSVTLEELAEKAHDYDLIAYHRPNGNPELIRHFIAIDIPVITRTWLQENEDIGHYRVVKGYDETTKELIQDDSLQNKNLRYSYDSFNSIWEKFNYKYLVLVPHDKKEVAEKILGDNLDEKKAWKKAADNNRQTLEQDSSDINTRFNLAVALYNLGDYKRSAQEFEKIESALPQRTMWYQIEPIKAYFQLGNYERVFELTDRILNNQNRAFSELYILRGKIYEKQGNIDAARNEYQQALLYNTNLSEAKVALAAFEK